MPPKKPEKKRLDVLLVEKALAPSRERAQAMILAGNIRVGGARFDKPGTPVPADSNVEVSGETLRYASRAGLKLEGALQDFGVSCADSICLDVGSSNGGFTDCLLQRGARKVFAVDVTISQLDWKLRQDARVVPIEKNARYLSPGDLLEKPHFVTMDLSFISVAKVLSAVLAVTAAEAEFIILIKPQFELEKSEIGKGGIVRDSSLHEKAIERVVSAAKELGLAIVDVKPSRLPGAEGNQEFFLHARRGGIA